MDWLWSEAADHWGAAAVFRKCSSQPGCDSDVYQDSSKATNWMVGTWPLIITATFHTKEKRINMDMIQCYTPTKGG